MESVHGLRNTFTNHCLWTQLTMTSMLLLLLNLKLPFCFFPEIYIFSVQTFDIYFCSTVNKIWVSEIYSFSLHFNFTLYTESQLLQSWGCTFDYLSLTHLIDLHKV